MSAPYTKLIVTKEKEIEMTKTLSVLAVVAHAVAFLFATYLMVLDKDGYSFVYSVIAFVTLPITIVLAGIKLSK
jgi:hypothetical protein